MANHAITPDYSEELRELLTSDPSHADVFNPLFSRLINNDAFMKAFIERAIKEHNHSGVDGEGSKIPFENIDVPTGLGNILTDKDLADHTNERNPHGTRASDVGAAPAHKLDEHLADEMPHQFIDQGKTYRWGFRVSNGEPQFIYEEVIG